MLPELRSLADGLHYVEYVIGHGAAGALWAVCDDGTSHLRDADTAPHG